MNIINNELFGLLITIGIYLVFSKISQKYKLINPLLFTTLTIIVILMSLNIDFKTYNQSAQFITLLLKPATVALAIPLYQHRKTIQKYLKPILVGVFSGVIIHLILILVCAGALDIDQTLLMTVFPKSITTAIAKDISFQLGGNVEITIALVIITGIFGSICSSTVFKLLKIKSPITKGLALGTSSHAVGTGLAIETGEIEGTFSSIALILTGLMTVFIAPIFALFF